MSQYAKVEVITVIFCIIAISTLAGCLDSTPSITEKRIGRIRTGDSLVQSRQDILAINYSKIAPIAEQMGYDATNGSGGGIVSYMFTKMENNTNRASLIINIFSSTSKSSIGGDYDPDIPFPESNLSEKKQWLTERVNEIAIICNLTVNWTQVQWSVTYAD